MTTEEMLLYYYFKDKFEINFRIYWGLFILLAASLSEAVFIDNCRIISFSFFAFICTSVAFVIYMIQILLSELKKDKFYNSLRKKADLINYRKQQVATRLYGWPEGILAAIECEEAHLVGDCPLCGAT